MDKKYVISGSKVVKATIILGLIASLMSTLRYSDSESLYLFCFLLFANFII